MLRSSRFIAVLLASALLAGPARPALADPRPASAKDQKLASELVKKAIALAESGDHNGAIQLYNDANRLVPNVLLLPSIGAQYQELGQWDDALEYFCRYLKEDPNGVNVPFAKRSAKRAQQEIGRKSADPCAATGDAGDRRKIDDGSGKRRTDDVEPRHRTDDGEGKARPDDGEGKRRSREPDVKRKPDDGDGGTTAIDPPPPPPRPNGNSTLMYIGLGAGIAGIFTGGLGLYYGYQGNRIADRINNHPPGTPWPPDIRQMQDEGERDNRNQVICLVATGALIATGVVLYVVGRPDTIERASDKTVVVAPAANGITVFGRF